LITKEFENDVPVRCVIFLDTSEGVRLGPSGNTLLTRLAGIAAIVAQASAANRDLVGLTTVDEREAKPIAPARTRLHGINLLRRLAEVSALQPSLAGVPPDQLSRHAHALAHELYPELMTSNVNSTTYGRRWIPILDRKWGWLVFGSVLIGALLFVLGSWAVSLRMMSPEQLVDRGDIPTRVWHWMLRNCRAYFLRSLDDAARLVPSRMPFLWKLPLILATFLLTYFPPATLGLIFWFFHSIRGWFGERKRELVRRKQLSALYSLQDGTGADGVERYAHDDGAYTARTAKFLQHHLQRCPIPLYDEKGRFRFRCEGKAAVLAEAMIRAVGRARDNELYVVLADLAELGEDLAPIVKACRVARARHHHVLVIVPWPNDVPPPDVPIRPSHQDEIPSKAEISIAKGNERSGGKRLPEKNPVSKNEERDALKLVRDSLTLQYQESFRILRRQLGRVGATVMRANDGDPVQLVLDRLDRLRGMRSRR
jgi:hypothetical protein